MWDIIQELRRTKGTNAKKVLLENHPELKPFLLAAYHPFMQYGIAPPQTGGFGTECFGDKSHELLSNLASGKLSGHAAKREVTVHLNELDYGSSQMFKCILNKSFDIGLAEKSINEVFPGLIPVHAIQLAKPVDWRRVLFPCYVSPKLDGLRAIYRNGEFFSRKGHKLQGLTILAGRCKMLFPTQALDGELMVPGVHFNEVSGKIRSFDETPDAVYHVFDLPDHHGNLWERYKVLKNIAPLRADSQVQVVPHHLISSQSEAQAWYDTYHAMGLEGAMLKDPEALYENGRSWSWQKMKAVESADCKVTGIFEGQGKYAGLCGGIYVDFNGVRVGVGSGLTDYQRNAWADTPEDIIGSIVEVAYQEVTPDGSLRHPRLTCVRGDL